MIPTKKYRVIKPIISNSPLYLHQTASSSDTATPVPSKRTFLMPNTSIQNIKIEPNNYPHTTQGRTILIDKKMFKIVSFPSSRMRAVNIGTNSPGKQPSTNVIKVCSSIYNFY